MVRSEGSGPDYRGRRHAAAMRATAAVLLPDGNQPSLSLSSTPKRCRDPSGTPMFAVRKLSAVSASVRTLTIVRANFAVSQLWDAGPATYGPSRFLRKVSPNAV